MKWISGLLLLANLAVAGYFLWVKQAGTFQARQFVPLNADKISLQSVHISGVSKKGVTDSALNASEQICVEWRGMLERDLERGREAIKKLATQRVMSVEELPVSRMYWVIFPPLPSEAAGLIKLRELAALKAKEATLIKDGNWKYGISLGLYANEETARRRLREIEGMGVTGLRLETQPKPGTTFYYLIRSEDIATLKDLDNIRQSFPATTITRVACKK
ncbi:MAG: hypothetical protein HXY27_00550 [Hydrogenophilaceae bacterium]|nr:hypothetical protein [Hydrogenophilaceae bacterium]